MSSTLNLLHDPARVNLRVAVPSLFTAAPYVAERPSGYALPASDDYARRIADEAEAWLDHARERSRMRDHTLVRKALHSLAFSLRHRAHDFCVPSKLSGTSKHQPALWRLTRNRVGFDTALGIEEVSDGERHRLVVSYKGERLGEIQRKHVGWFRPLIPFGAGVWLTRVTGHEERFTLGCNIVLGRVGSAVSALNHALGTDVGGYGYGGDGAATAPTETASAEAEPLPAHGGDGAGGPARVRPARALEDVRFWRDEQGTLRMSVPHVVKHSPTGPEVGYRGSGPADAALSVLAAVTSREEAERFYQLYKDEIIARLPEGGGVIRAADVLAWLGAQRTERS